MDITPSLAGDRQVIQSYGPEGFRIGGQVYRHPVLVWPDHVERWEIPACHSERSEESLSGSTAHPLEGILHFVQNDNIEFGAFARILAYEPKAEFILLGCGARGIFVPPVLKQALREAGLGIDAMDTGAACRTYNIMLTEERPVVAALMVG